MNAGGLSDEQYELAAAVRALVTKRSDSAAVRAAVDAPGGYDEKLWSELCQGIGVGGLAIPEEYGGVGAGIAELQVVFEELGRALTPSPLLGSVALAGQAVLETGDESACQRLLPGIADGTTIAALAWTGQAGDWDPLRQAFTATALGDDGFELDGRAEYVLNGAEADVLLAPAMTESGVELFEVDAEVPGVYRDPVPTLDATRRLATVRFAGVRARKLECADAVAVLRRVRDLGCVALSGEQTGAAARCLELTVEYTKQRKQFGQPIGSFQALKHRLADVYVRVEAARSASWAAARAADEYSDVFWRDAAVAKVCCSETLRLAAAEMVQLHGGIAITWEHDAHLYLKRAQSSDQLLGHAREYLARLGAASRGETAG
jgi:alkylation response protein AidB-like acyl-CoA dehydrogenase